MLILLFTSYKDLKTREIPDTVHILIILTALIQIDPINSLLGFFIVPFPFLIVALINEGGIGGGDIKLVGACSFLVGIKYGILACTISMILAVFINLLIKNSRQKSFPLAPYLAAGFTAAYIISIYFK